MERQYETVAILDVSLRHPVSVLVFFIYVLYNWNIA